MSSTQVHNPLVKSIDPTYSKKLLEFNGYTIIGSAGTLIKVEGFDDYNHLIDINSVFSTSPCYEPVDRTNRVHGPIRYSTPRPWKIPSSEASLEQALESRVYDICNRGQMINLFWSGGIDSTTIMVAFLKYAPDLSRCRVIYSPWSIYEHPEFFKLLQQIGKIELIDISGEVYFDLDLDGVFVSGNTGDELHASLDQSFFEEYGYNFLSTSWRDFFYKKNSNDDFIEFAEDFFSAAGRDIKTVLEARWWFYASSKLTSLMNFSDLNFLCSGPTQFDPSRLIGFFDYDEYEQFVYFNLDRLIHTDNYASWRQFLKDYCYEFDGFDDWRTNKTKFNSSQVVFYNAKKRILNDLRNLMLLEDGTRVATQNLPLFSQREWAAIASKYQYVFSKPYTV